MKIFDFFKRKDTSVDVKIFYGKILSADFFNWLLDRCDSYVDDRVARCANMDQAVKLVDELKHIGIDSEVLEKLHVPERLDVYRLYCLHNWYRNEEPFSKSTPYNGR